MSAGRGATLWLAVLVSCVACDNGPAPQIDTSGMEPPVRELIRERRAGVADDPGSASWGALGDALLAHGLEAEAAECYAKAVPITEDPFEWLYLQALADRDSAEALFDRAAILFAFEQVGGAQACLDMGTDYAKNRFAFGRAIGS